MIKAFVILAGLTLCLGAAPASFAGQPLAPVQVTGGQIAGSQEGTVKVWQGIPFAAPPVGDLRWRSPQAVAPWTGVKTTQAYAPACAQTAVWVSEPKSEDCLYLNVWAPEDAKNLPVLVWIHGGGYFGGSASQGLYDGANLARHGAVVVTINYRLGIFGFFAHPDLAADTTGNQGIEDQIAALGWVRDNIATFGGDPSRVTIFGESAGGNSVAVLVASPGAKGLFQRAIAQSGNYSIPIDPSENGRFSRADAERKAVAFTAAAGARNIADLRKMTVADLHRIPWSPVTHIDGRILVEDLTTTYANHRQNDLPLMVGWTADEGKDLAPEILATAEFTAANHEALITKLLGYPPSQALLDAYPGATNAEAKRSIHRATNDWWGWRLVHWAGLQHRHGRSPTYVYQFAHMPAKEPNCGYGCGIGHGAEILYVFDNLDTSPRAWTAQDRQLASQLADTWVRFAATGTPEGAGLPAWPAFDGSAATARIITMPDDAPAAPLPDFSLFLRDKQNDKKEAQP